MNQFTKKHLDQEALEIVNKYPLVFTEFDEDNWHWYLKENPEAIQSATRDDYVNLRFGFECGKGWYGLIEEYASSISILVEDLREIFGGVDPRPYAHTCIVKEKLGELVFQGHISLPAPYNQFVRAYESYMTRASCNICELTGVVGARRCRTESGWIRTLCKEQAKELNYTPIK